MLIGPSSSINIYALPLPFNYDMFGCKLIVSIFDGQC